MENGNKKWALIGVAVLGGAGGFGIGYVVGRRRERRSWEAFDTWRKENVEGKPKAAVRKVGALWLDVEGTRHYDSLMTVLKKYGCDAEVDYALSNIKEQAARDKRVRKATRRVTVLADQIAVNKHLAGIMTSTVRCCKSELRGVV